MLYLYCEFNFWLFFGEGLNCRAITEQKIKMMEFLFQYNGKGGIRQRRIIQSQMHCPENMMTKTSSFHIIN